MAQAASIKLPSPAPVSLQLPVQRSRTSSHRPSPARGRRAVSSVGPDEDAEGEDDVEDAGDDGEDNEDKSLYCFCQKMSYGEVRCPCHPRLLMDRTASDHRPARSFFSDGRMRQPEMSILMGE